MTAKRTLRAAQTLKALEKAVMRRYAEICEANGGEASYCEKVKMGASTPASKAMVRACARHAAARKGGRKNG